ncbi:MAG: Crp/Fnr family transcriptional regulator [Rubrobacter sp.]
MEIEQSLSEYARLREQECKELLRLFEELGIATAERVYSPGDVVYREGEYGDGLYILTSGVLKLFRPYSAAKEATLRLLNNWDIFGHLAFEGETKQRAYAEAVTECRVTKAPKIFVERAIKRDSRVAFKILTLSELRLVQYEELVKCLLPRETEIRIANLLPLLAQKFGKPDGEGGIVIELRLTHQDLAAMVASTRESVTKVLNEFRTRNLIAIQSGRITLKDQPALEILSRD